MRKPQLRVIDSNIRQDEALLSYLGETCSNLAVITDYGAMEAYKGKDLQSIYQSIEILGKYPKQVIILKSTSEACALDGKKAGIRTRLIDEEQTNDFAEYVKNLQLAKDGNINLQKQLRAHETAANSHMNRILSDAPGVLSSFPGIATCFSNNELMIIRKGQEYSQQLIDKIVKNTLLLAAHMFSKHPLTNKLPSYEELLHTFIFKYSLCALLMVVDWVSKGGVENIRADKIRNDLVDLNYISFGLFFDGVLSKDKKMLAREKEAKAFLQLMS